MTPIERAGVAIIDALREQGDLMKDCGDPVWAQVDGAFRVEPLVRAVLRAIREPSDAMVKAVPDDRNAPIYPEDIWQAMIDAALGDG